MHNFEVSRREHRDQLSPTSLRHFHQQTFENARSLVVCCKLHYILRSFLRIEWGIIDHVRRKYSGETQPKLITAAGLDLFQLAFPCLLLLCEFVFTCVQKRGILLPWLLLGLAHHHMFPVCDH